MRTKKDINIHIGEQVRLAREEAHLTQEQLAERVEVSPQYISDVERGVVGVSLTTLKRLCVSLGVSSDRILFGQDGEGHAVIAEKCRALTKEQFLLLLEIVDRYVQAVESERRGE